MRAQVGRGACVQVSRGRRSRGAGWPPEDGLSEMLRPPVVGRSRRSRGGARWVLPAPGGPVPSSGAPRERMQFSVEETRIICLCSPRRWEQVAGDSELLY